MSGLKKEIVAVLITALFVAFELPVAFGQTADNFQVNTINWFGGNTPAWGEISFEILDTGTAVQYLGWPG